MTSDQFFSTGPAQKSLFVRLGEALAQLLQTPPEDVHVFSVAAAAAETTLDVWFAARRSGYDRKEKLLGYLAAGRAQVSPRSRDMSSSVVPARRVDVSKTDPLRLVS